MIRVKLPRSRETIDRQFTRCCLGLRERYTPYLVSPDNSETRLFLLGGRAGQVLQDPGAKAQITEFYHLYCEYRDAEDLCVSRRLRKNLLGTCFGQGADCIDSFFTGIVGGTSIRTGHQCTRAQLFATLVLCNLPVHSQALRRFVEHTIHSHTKCDGFCDNVLPLRSIAEVCRWLGDESDDIRKFYSSQFIVRPHIIGGDSDTVPDNGRFPELEEQRILGGEGDSKIFRVKIDHSNCHASIPSGWILRKDLVKKDTREVDIHRLLRTQVWQHKHIRNFYGYAKSKTHTAIYMEYGDYTLHEYMERNDWPQYFLSSKVEGFEKLLGIADALNYLHCGIRGAQRCAMPESIRHGDVRASNIIVVTDHDGIVWFKLSDFDISSVGRNPGPNTPEQSNFLPPECLSRLEPRQDKTTKSDIWQFGCLCLEHLAWLCDGMGAQTDSKGLAAFREQRRNQPCPEAEEYSSRWFFVIEADTQRDLSDYPAERDSERWRDREDFHAIRKSDCGTNPLVMRLNPAVTSYFYQLSTDCNRPLRERQFIAKVFEILRTSALVPNPLQRGSMHGVCEKLTAVVYEFGQN